jgi:hypothetical protein
VGRVCLSVCVCASRFLPHKKEVGRLAALAAHNLNLKKLLFLTEWAR